MLVFRPSDYSELAGSLATVAIASLGGPLTAGGAALAEVVKHTQARYEAGAPTRDLRRHVTMEIRQWAESERFTSEQIELGLALATETTARFGLDIDTIAALQFDPEGVQGTGRRGPRTLTGDRGSLRDSRTRYRGHTAF